MPALLLVCSVGSSGSSSVRWYDSRKRCKSSSSPECYKPCQLHTSQLGPLLLLTARQAPKCSSTAVVQRVCSIKRQQVHAAACIEGQKHTVLVLDMVQPGGSI